MTTEIRSTGHSASNAVARLAGSLSPFLVKGSTGFEKIGLVMMIVSFATAFLVHHLPETNGQRMGEVTPVDPDAPEKEEKDKYQMLT